MQTVPLAEAQSRLPELIRSLLPGEQIVITSGDKPVAKLTPAEPRPSLRDIKPVSVGAVLRPFPHRDDDLLEEMLNRQ
ncbi:MAG: type II toxin-antitoxin system Phd/YefM family antitoxin [Chloroflexi bacterium]|nr:type II toxin-antitoxin system Phd/YefM family antitoxin [Chloroflexota bacterium]